MSDIIFALDIGTRSVVGVVCEISNDMLKVLDIKRYFHKNRSMIDGQIEDIMEVSRVVGNVKNQLEESLNIVLDNVCIAAAGRALKTEQILLEKEIDIRVPISYDFIKVIEMEALQLAQDVFSVNSSNNDLFYCVGYSVLNYKLDGRSMQKIQGHRGNKVSVEIIAAFLPHTVIEGLYSCMDNNNLEVKNLTLEPIAAMDLIIPPELRLLNLALVDIGAGTSDIAISKNGSIVGYDMATIAGDEITECLMKNYIVDFNTAEEIKVKLSDEKDFISITNILGISLDISKQEILESIKTAVYDLCSDISTKIHKMNKEAPAAIFLAGGGSKTPFLKEFLSELMNVPESRIALTDKKSIKNIQIDNIQDYGPELITPLGIAYSVVLNKNYDFFSVDINDKKVRLYGIRELKVMDALLMSGFDIKKLIGISGKSLRFTFNGNQRYYAGEFSTPSQIYVNNNLANIETTIKPGDKIKVVPATNGITPIVKIADLIETENTHEYVYFNGIKTSLAPKYIVNNTEVTKDYVIGNSDIIEVEQLKTLGDLYKLFKVNELHESFINGEKIDLDFQLVDGLKIDTVKTSRVITETVALTLQENKEKKEKEADDFIEVNLNNKIIKLPKQENNVPYIFADMLNYTDIDPSNPKGNIILLHNGKEASYLNTISNNDVIIIKWNLE